MGDGRQHNLSAFPKLKALSVEEHLSEVQKRMLCFCCLRSGHWLNSCRNLKPCGVNGCTRSHNALLHSSRNVTPDGNNETAASTNPAATEAVTPSTEHSSASHKSSSDSVLLQVVPVTLYGPKGYFNTYAMLHWKYLQSAGNRCCKKSWPLGSSGKCSAEWNSEIIKAAD